MGRYQNNNKPKTSNLSSSINIEKNGNILNDPQCVANEFNTYFSSIADKILNSKKYTANINFSEYLSNPLPNSIELRPCSAIEIENLIISLKDGKSNGPSSIPNSILKLLKSELSTILNQLFNLSLTTGIHPEILRTAKTIPIFKKGSKLSISNYRPISLLSNINKIL